MSSNPEKVPSSEIKRVTRTFHGKQKTIQWRGLSLTIKRLLAPIDMLRMIDKAISMCQRDDDFCVGLLDLSFRINVIAYYTNIEMPEDIDEINYILYETDLFRRVCENINGEQLESIKRIISIQ